jgi:phosphoribosylamine-glycine ligase
MLFLAHFLQGISCFGPSRAASRIESSKAWAKEFMRRHGIPTAAFEVFRDFPAAEAHLRSAAHRVVIKVRCSGVANSCLGATNEVFLHLRINNSCLRSIVRI